jgi:hypothetical protein
LVFEFKFKSHFLKVTQFHMPAASFPELFAKLKIGLFLSLGLL